MTTINMDTALMGLVIGGEVCILIAVIRIWKSLKERKKTKKDNNKNRYDKYGSSAS